MNPESRSSQAASVPPARSSGLALAIFKKELRDIFRDKRTVITVVLFPLFFFPALFALQGALLGKQQAKMKAQTYAVGLIGEANAPQLAALLRRLPGIHLQPVEKAAAEKQIKERHLNAAVELPPGADTLLQESKAVPIPILLDEGDESSQFASHLLESSLTSIGQQIVKQRLEARGLSPEFATPLRVTMQPIAAGGNVLQLILASFVPYLFIMSAIQGASTAAIDLVAGEKERSTLETLLVSPVTRRDIVLGKFYTVLVACILSGLLSITGLLIPLASGMKMFGDIGKGGLHLTPIGIGVILLTMLPLSTLFASLLLAMSTFARNQREAQAYLFPLLIAAIVPAFASMTMGGTIASSVALVPILNAAIIIRQALNGSYDPGFIVLAFVASILYAALALVFATRLFEKESVLLKA